MKFKWMSKRRCMLFTNFAEISLNCLNNNNPIPSTPAHLFSPKGIIYVKQNRLEKKHSQRIDTIRTHHPCGSWKAETRLLLCFRTCLQNLLFPFCPQPIPTIKYWGNEFCVKAPTAYVMTVLVFPVPFLKSIQSGQKSTWILIKTGPVKEGLFWRKHNEKK